MVALGASLSPSHFGPAGVLRTRVVLHGVVLFLGLCCWSGTGQPAPPERGGESA